MYDNKKDIKQWLDSYNIENYTINNDLTVDVDGDVRLEKLPTFKTEEDYQLYMNSDNKGNLEKLPVKFGTVTGNFDCSNNQLITLEGSPISVGKNFDCTGNQLTSLEGSPKLVGGHFDCSATLNSNPDVYGMNYFYTDNKLTSLQGAPTSVGGNFDCSGNRLTSLEGAPEIVGGDFFCNNKVEISDVVLLDNNDYLKSLEGAPKVVGGNFVLNTSNKLDSYKGLPLEIGGKFEHGGDTKLGIKKNQSLTEVRAILLKKQLEKELNQKPKEIKSKPLKI